MIWKHEWMLWASPLVLLFCTLLVVYLLSIRSKTIRTFGNPNQVNALIRGNHQKWRIVRAALGLFALSGLWLTLAGPQYGSRTQVIKNKGIDLVLALDFSKSMWAQDIRPNRIERAKAEILAFLEELSGDRVGLVAFAGETMEFPMTVDYSSISLFLKGLDPSDMPVGGTAIGRALIASKRLIERSTTTTSKETSSNQAQRAAQVVLLITDGEDHEGDPVEAAKKLAEKEMKLFILAVGSRSGEPIPTYSPDGTWTGYMRDEDQELITTSLSSNAEQTLREMAEQTGGKLIRLQKGTQGFREALSEIRKLKQADREDRLIEVHEEQYFWFLLPAFLFLFLQTLLPEAMMGKLKFSQKKLLNLKKKEIQAKDSRRGEKQI